MAKQPASSAVTASPPLAGSLQATGSNGQDVPGLIMFGQAQSNWCWASVIQTILLHRDATSLSQEEIVTAHLQRTGRTYSCASPNSTHQSPGGICQAGSCSASCNDEHAMEVTLAEYGLYDMPLSINDAPDFEDIQQEIDAARPVPSHVSWNSGGGHIILVSGWSIDAHGKPTVHVLDPDSSPAGETVVARPVSYATYKYSYKQDGKSGRVDFSYKVDW